MHDYHVDTGKIHLGRQPGISGFMRIRNEEEYLAQAIESHLPFLDELVIVYNRCSDRSEEIISSFVRRDSRIRAWHYEPLVYPQGSTQYCTLPPDSENSLVNYYNFALAKTTRRTVLKIDGDDIAMSDKIKVITDAIRDGKLRAGQFWVTAGINLWRCDDRMFVNGRHPFPGLDHGFFQVTENVCYAKGEQCEYLTGKLSMMNAGYMYYHAKGLKKDRGLGNYDFELNPESYYRRISYQELESDELLTFDQLIAKFPNSEELKFISRPEQMVRLNGCS